MMKVSRRRCEPYSMRGKPLLVERYKPHNMARLDIVTPKFRDGYFLLKLRAGKW